MKYTLGVLVFGAVLLIGATVIVVGLGVLCFVSIKALRVYMRSKEVREEKAIVKQSLGEVIKRHREECKMTQEFVSAVSGCVCRYNRTGIRFCVYALWRVWYRKVIGCV